MISEYQYDIFLSHSNSDKKIVRRVANKLTKMGFKVWLDEWEIFVGEKIIQKLSLGLEQSIFVGIWLTQNSIKSNWVEEEWHTKYSEGIKDGKVSILPLIGEKIEIPYLLKKLKHADFSTNFNSGFNELVKALDNSSIKTLLELKRNLISGNFPEESAKKITEITLNRNLFLGIEILWESIIETEKPTIVLDHCAWSVGKIALESQNKKIYQKSLEIIFDSVNSKSNLIIEKFAYTALRLYNTTKNKILKDELHNYINSNAYESKQSIFVKEIYTHLVRRYIE